MLLVGAALLAGSRAAGAQQAYRIGMLMGGGPQEADARRFLRAFEEGMQGLGYEPGRGYVLAVRHYGRERGKVGVLADELIAWRAEVIVANLSSTAAEVKKRAGSVPIVMATAIDAVGEGLAASLARPGGNVTGLTGFGPPMYAKLVELVRELLPRAERIGLVINPSHSLAKAYEGAAIQAAVALGLKATSLPVRSAADVEDMRRAVGVAALNAIVIATDGVLFALRQQIVNASLSALIPAVALLPEFADEGAVASYGFDIAESYREVARYVDRLRKGAKAAELPIEQPRRFQLAVNRSAATKLGVAIPAALLARADRVIE